MTLPTPRASPSVTSAPRAPFAWRHSVAFVALGWAVLEFLYAEATFVYWVEGYLIGAGLRTLALVALLGVNQHASHLVALVGGGVRLALRPALVSSFRARPPA